MLGVLAEQEVVVDNNCIQEVEIAVLMPASSLIWGVSLWCTHLPVTLLLDVCSSTFGVLCW